MALSPHEPGRSEAGPPASGPFDPPGVQWSRVSPRLATARRIALAVWLGVVTVVLLVGGPLVGPWWLAWAALVPMLLLVWGWWLIGRQVAAIGYAERDDDLLVRHGVLARTVVVVPYGRMQYVDVHSGPVARWLGIARLQLHTASAGTDAHIPGLVADEAARLRDRLASRGEARLAGL